MDSKSSQKVHRASKKQDISKFERSFHINLSIENKDSHLGTFQFEIYPKMSLRFLKMQVEKELGIATSSQRWIFCQRLAENDDLALYEYGVFPNSPVFLYVETTKENKICSQILHTSGSASSYIKGSKQDINAKSLGTEIPAKEVSEKPIKVNNMLFQKDMFGACSPEMLGSDTGIKVSQNSLYTNDIYTLLPTTQIPMAKTLLQATQKHATQTLLQATQKPVTETLLQPSQKPVTSEPVCIKTLTLENKFNKSAVYVPGGTSQGVSKKESLGEKLKRAKEMAQKNASMKFPILDLQTPCFNSHIKTSNPNLEENMKDKSASNIHISNAPGFKMRSADFEIESILEDLNNVVREENYNIAGKHSGFNTEVNKSIEKFDVNKVVISEKEICATKILNDDTLLPFVLEDQNMLQKIPDSFSLLTSSSTSLASENADDYSFGESSTSVNEKNDQTSEEQCEPEVFVEHFPIVHPPREALQNFKNLLEIENLSLVRNVVNFTCPICFCEVESQNGVILHECLHMFCVDCLGRTVEYAEEALVKCPYRDETYSCESYLQQREIKALVSEDIYERYLQRSINTAEGLAEKSFHCKTLNCKGWFVFDENINIFHCPVCSHYNCLNCNAIHEGLNCKGYQDKLKKQAHINQDSEKTLSLLNKMVGEGKAMKCPKCDLFLMKRWGCDWLKCSICHTEICWITKGPRWGPGGQGDTSAGCKCGVNGIKCHPSCTYCH